MEAAVVQIFPHNSPNRLSELERPGAPFPAQARFSLKDGVELAGSRLGVDHAMLLGISRSLDSAHEWLAGAAQSIEEGRVSLLQFAVAGASHCARQGQRVVREYLREADLNPEGHQLVNQFSLLSHQVERVANALSDGRARQASGAEGDPFRDFLLQRATFERIWQETTASLSRAI